MKAMLLEQYEPLGKADIATKVFSLIAVSACST